MSAHHPSCRENDKSLIWLCVQCGGHEHATDIFDALRKAKETIRALHGEIAWEIYDKHSPEMKQINQALAKEGKLI